MPPDHVPKDARINPADKTLEWELTLDFVRAASQSPGGVSLTLRGSSLRERELRMRAISDNS